MKIANGTVDQHSRISKIDENDDKSIQVSLPANETRLALLGNLFVSEGKPGKVITTNMLTILVTTLFSRLLKCMLKSEQEKTIS